MTQGDIQLFRFDPSIELETKNRETMKIEIHTIKRTGRKFTTRICNLEYHIDISLKDFVKYCRVQLVCGGNIKKEIDPDSDEINQVVQLQGHHKHRVKGILINKYGISNYDIVERGI